MNPRQRKNRESRHRCRSTIRATRAREFPIPISSCSNHAPSDAPTAMVIVPLLSMPSRAARARAGVLSRALMVTLDRRGRHSLRRHTHALTRMPPMARARAFRRMGCVRLARSGGEYRSTSLRNAIPRPAAPRVRGLPLRSPSPLLTRGMPRLTSGMPRLTSGMPRLTVAPEARRRATTVVTWATRRAALAAPAYPNQRLTASAKG